MYIRLYNHIYIYMRLPPKSAHGSWGRRAGPDSSQLPYVCVRLAQDSALGSKSRAAPPKLASTPNLATSHVAPTGH